MIRTLPVADAAKVQAAALMSMCDGIGAGFDAEASRADALRELAAEVAARASGDGVLDAKVRRLLFVRSTKRFTQDVADAASLCRETHAGGGVCDVAYDRAAGKWRVVLISDEGKRFVTSPDAFGRSPETAIVAAVLRREAFESEPARTLVTREVA